MRTCSICKKKLPDDAFNAKRSGKDSRCRECKNARERRRYREKLKKTPPKFRTCTKCGKTFPREAFHASDLREHTRCAKCKATQVSEYHHKLKKDRRCFHCRKKLNRSEVSLCGGCKAKARSRYHANGEEYRAKGRQRKRDLRLAAFEVYGGPVCACCGEDQYEFLTIDHVNGDGAEHRRKLKKKHGYVVEIYRWLKNNRYPEGFQVLCWNCNCAKAHFGQCPHETERSGAAKVVP